MGNWCHLSRGGARVPLPHPSDQVGCFPILPTGGWGGVLPPMHCHCIPGGESPTPYALHYAYLGGESCTSRVHLCFITPGWVRCFKLAPVAFSRQEVGVVEGLTSLAVCSLGWSTSLSWDWLPVADSASFQAMSKSCIIAGTFLQVEQSIAVGASVYILWGLHL